MNYKQIIILLLLVLIAGCKEESKVEILESVELEYYTKDKIENPAQIFDEIDSKKLNSDFLQIAESMRKEYKNFPDTLILHLEIFMDESGRIDYIKNLKRVEESNRKMINKFYNEIGKLFSEIKVSPATKQGAAVKFRTDTKIGIEKSADSLRLFIPDFLSINMSDFSLKRLNKDAYSLEVDEMPMPVGGIASIAKNIVYPAAAKEAGVVGRVFVKVYINEEGIVTATEIIRGIGYGCDEAARKAIEKTKFTPGRRNGEPLKSQVSIPIFFKLQ